MNTREPVRIEYPNGVVFEPDKIDLGLTNEAKDILDTFDKNVFYLEDHIGSAEEYESFLWMLIRTMEYGYEHEEFRKHPVQFKFYHNDKEQVKWLQFNHFISNCILWIPMVYITNYLADAWFDDSLVIKADRWPSMTTDRVCEWMDDQYTDPYAQLIDSKGYGRSIANTEFFMSQEAVIFLPFMGLSVTLELFIDLAKRMPRYKELLYFKLDTTKQPNELEQDARVAEEEHRALIINDKEFNPLKSLIHAIKGGQLREVHTIIGCKADDNGNTIAEPINVNYITGSLNNLVYYYINGIGGRKAAVYNKEYMGKTGHLLNLVVKMASTVKLSKAVPDCHSANPIPITLKSKKHLQKMHGRYARYVTETDYWVIDEKNEDLIGQTLFVRSPATCCAPDGVCPVCYGTLYHNNKYLNSPGAYSAVLVMNPVVQAIMEVKHFQTTNSTPIVFQDDFYRFFELSGDEIIIGKDIDFIEDYALIIRKDDLYSVDPDEDMDALFRNASTKKKRRKRSYEDDEANSIEAYDFGGGDESLSAALELTYATTKFEVMRLNVTNGKLKKKGDEERYIFHDSGNKELSIHTDFISRMKTGTDEHGDYYYIPLTDISMEEFIFMVEVENEEKSKAAKQIQNLINNKSHEGCDTIETITQKFLDLLIDARLEATSVHAEMIMYKLIRDVNNILKRPDFRRVIMKGGYHLLSLTTALKHDPSITISISTPFLKYQLVGSDTTFEKRGVSDLDWMFRRTLPAHIDV